MPDATAPTDDQDDLAARLERLERDLVRWRALALTSWADALAQVRYDEDGLDRSDEAARLRTELHRMRSTLSWRITRPLRGARAVLARVRRA